MKPFIIIATALLSVAPVSAGVIDPVGFSQSFCSLRRAGVSAADAVARSTELNYDGSVEAIQLADGTDLDVYLGTRGAAALCPEFF